MDIQTHGEGAYSFVGKRTIEDLSQIYPGDNSGAGSVIIIPAIASPGCGCEYRCVALDEFSANVACICPEGWRLKRDNLTACECKYILRCFGGHLHFLHFNYNLLFAVINKPDVPMEYLIVFFAVVSILLIAALAALIFILCKYTTLEIIAIVWTLNYHVLLY